MEQLYTVQLAGKTLTCAFRFPEAARALNGVPISDTPASCGDFDPAAPPVRLPLEEVRYYMKDGMVDGPGSEASILTAFFSEALMPFDRCVIHAVAIRWREQAWLICAPSGVGKTTQARCLRELRPGEFGIICGDRPILEYRHSERSEESVSPVTFRHSERSEESVSSVPFRHSERSEESVSSVPKCHSERSEAEPRNPSLSSILVHPSPWNGKESWHDAPAAPLAGLILLERGDHNELLPLSAREAGIPVYLQMIHTNRDVEHIKQAAAMTTLLLGSVPAWKLISYQVPDSTKLLLETLFQSDRL